MSTTPELRSSDELDKLQMPPTGSMVTLKAPIVLVGLGVTILFTALLLVVVANGWETSLQYKDALTAFTAGIVCTSLVYTAKTFEQNWTVNELRLRLDKLKMRVDDTRTSEKLVSERKVQALNLIGDWHRKEMIECANVVRIFLEKPENQQDLFTFFSKAENADKRAAAMVVLNFFERIAFAYRSEVVDQELIRQFFEGLFRFYFFKFKDYIDKRQTDTANGKIFECFEELAKSWAKPNPKG